MTPEIRKIIISIHLEYKVPVRILTELTNKIIGLFVQEDHEYEETLSFRIRKRRTKKPEGVICNRRSGDRRNK